MTMKTIKVAEATKPQLDWLVAKSRGMVFKPVAGAGSIWFKMGIWTPPGPNGEQVPFVLDHEYREWSEKCDGGVLRRGTGVWRPTTDPAQMWPIIEREGIDVRFDRDRVFDPGETVERWYASKPFDIIPDTDWVEYGPTVLIAAARCYVASKLGETVEIPEELV